MKQILIVSDCPRRGNSIGLIGILLDLLNQLPKSDFNISLFDTSFYERNHQASDYNCDHYYSIYRGWFACLISKIPRLRAYYASWLIVSKFKSILSQKKFDGVVMYQIQPMAESLTQITHKCGSKMFFLPWGSEILRVPSKVKKSLIRAFASVDYVIGGRNSNTIIAAKNDYFVPDYKIKEIKYDIVGVRKIDEYRFKYSKKEMTDKIGIPYSDYNILCGYNGFEGQRHIEIIEAIANNINNLPADYLLIFPITYGAKDGYVNELKELCDLKGLKSYFITQYLTNDQVAFLHLITDLFIQIQPTDSGNAFMIEALFAKNTIITGRWLQYNQFEQYGVPYYLLNAPGELAYMLKSVLLHQIDTPSIPQQLIDYYKPDVTKSEFVFWKSLFEEL